MRLRFAIGAFLLVVGIVLPAVVMAKRGAPWSFRGHQAVVIEATGAVELFTGDGTKVAAAAGTFLNAGYTVRVPRLGEARLRMPHGDVVVGEKTDVTIDDKGVTLGSGVVEIQLPKGATPPFEVKAEGIPGTIIPRPGGDEGGLARVLVDKNGEMRGYAVRGSVEGSIKDGGPVALAESEKAVVVSADRRARVEGGPTGPLSPTWTCDEAKRLTLRVPAGTQVFVAKNVLYPKNGGVSVDVPEATAGVQVRDLAGNAWHKEIPCPSTNELPPPPPPPPPPAPGKPPKPPKPKPKTP